MKKEDKEVFFLSILTGLLGAWAFILGKGVQSAQSEEQRAMEDARIRFEHQQQSSENGGDGS